LTLVTIAVIAIAERVSLPLSLLLVVAALLGAGVGMIVEVLAVTPLQRTWRSGEERSEATFISTLAMFLILESVALNVTNAGYVRFPPKVFPVSSIAIAGLVISVGYLVSAVMGVGLIAAAWVTVRWTQVGRSLRAIAADPQMAGMLGINVMRYSFGSAIAGGAMAGLAGVLLAGLLASVTYQFGDQFLLRAFTVIVLGGLGSIPGVLVGSVIVAIVEALAIYFGASAWSLLTSGLLIMIVLVVRPQGIFGRERVDRA
jgi:branched-chain amino acid transport system permease protein